MTQARARHHRRLRVRTAPRVRWLVGVGNGHADPAPQPTLLRAVRGCDLPVLQEKDKLRGVLPYPVLRHAIRRLRLKSARWSARFAAG